MKREMSVAGTFYPDMETELERYFNHFNKIYEDKFTLPDTNTRAVIVPHAGYIYSGYTANIAYRMLHNSKIKNFVVIGPSHRAAFNGISICDAQSYDTPLGEIQSNISLFNMLQEKFDLKSILKPHQEHSTEVQFPFMKYYIEDVNLVELVYSDTKASFISEIIDFVLEQNDCGVIISTDLSHFYTLENANKLDDICLNAIAKLDINALHEGCEACGITGVEAMIMSAKRLNLKSTILDYRTSADASGDTSRVVGYVSAFFN